MLERLCHIAIVLLLLAVAGVAVSPVHSFDLFWQLQSGREMWQSGQFIRTDLFTLAATAPRYEHCWLHDLIVFAVYQSGGYAALSLLKGLLVTATCALTMLAARRRGASWAAILAFAPFCWLLTRGGWLERPQLWSMLAFAFCLWILSDARPGRRLWLLLPLPILWANLHAGAVLIVPLLGMAAAGTWGELTLRPGSLAEGRERAVRLSWLALLSLPALLMTPYGLETLRALWLAPRFGADSGLATQLYNLDWSATSWSNEPFYFILLGFCAALLLLCRRTVTLPDLLLLLLVSVMGYKLGRHTPFFYFALAALLPRYLDTAAALLGTRLRAAWCRWLCGAAMAAGLFLFLLFYRPALAESGFFRPGLRDWHYPLKATEFVRSEQLPGQLWNTYEWGGYLAWQLYPQYRVFWDGRQSSPEMFDYGMTVMRGDIGWEAILERFQVKTIVSKTCTLDSGRHYPLLDRLRSSPDWALVFADVPALVFVRRTAVSADWLRRFELPAERIDDVTLAEARLLVEFEPRRYFGWWEIARIQVARREYAEALPALENYLRYSPVRDPKAETLYRIIAPLQQERR